jgi:hypothetical protein
MAKCSIPHSCHAMPYCKTGSTVQYITVQYSTGKAQHRTGQTRTVYPCAESKKREIVKRDKKWRDGKSIFYLLVLFDFLQNSINVQIKGRGGLSNCPLKIKGRVRDFNWVSAVVSSQHISTLRSSLLRQWGMKGLDTPAIVCTVRACVRTVLCCAVMYCIVRVCGKV